MMQPKQHRDLIRSPILRTAHRHRILVSSHADGLFHRRGILWGQQTAAVLLSDVEHFPALWPAELKPQRVRRKLCVKRNFRQACIERHTAQTVLWWSDVEKTLTSLVFVPVWYLGRQVAPLLFLSPLPVWSARRAAGWGSPLRQEMLETFQLLPSSLRWDNYTQCI